MAGGPEALFSRRARKYREMGLAESPPDAEGMLRLMAGEYTFIARPVVAIGGRALAGFSEKRYRDFLGPGGGAGQ